MSLSWTLTFDGRRIGSFYTNEISTICEYFQCRINLNDLTVELL